MTITELEISGLFLIEPKIFEDPRGYFFESFHAEKFQEQTGVELSFVQDNESRSNKGVLRGLHFQAPPHAQGKLVRVTKGAVLDVAVDIRKNSPTYGHHVSVLLSGDNKKQLFVPPGFLHGFATLEDHTIFNYKCTDYYHPETEGTVLWNDSDLKINWTISEPTISAKDELGTLFKNFESPF